MSRKINENFLAILEKPIYSLGVTKIIFKKSLKGASHGQVKKEAGKTAPVLKRPALEKAQRAVEIPEEFQAPYAHWTVKQRLWFRYLIQLKSPSKAAAKAYDCKNDNVAGVIANENLRKLKISMSNLLDIMGLDAEADARDLARLRKAKRKTYFQYEGSVTDVREDDDFAAQAKALELTAKIKGHLKDNVSDKEQGGDINFITNVIGSFNGAGKGENTPDVAGRISESISLLKQNLDSVRTV